ncbi:8-amino-7-oxononanoate synthase OS=Tsukamurella paurometabola (strain ATCC 8368 / DSM / CCUG 35730 / CIP 100753 / JCM 10117 / KCTC 9821 / NBRC 16120 / NCIMB 702349 / NCTC 13040) OX=521096 GN=Tpau_1999 PE=3 SV=1 [Tsukamurella paurometabola]|uniref:8-amino-7-oxononanoate synthase n=1 Tax=Tsukamurella paurometabola (strain ATCC 8368 / DSM 20162 / CCUG 35730 / CIP 100753 / JCM 10117 / KCTC 9821 / NBRC 16120 / NCIMB 702349 / NCTC 13040) TaxID=521096 RepID=D5UNP3_TSUPD|nr:8-amino-7-oxononanoate synthase [Tsukamurella paurometabola]ADG78611.1 8-amino-7-oxononanoate synthase [Tsukamurella paurometabola DSM 20162]SUP32417.1 8-amino-7-oxononanoate synthase [Tsukamurella paurometabola]
MNGVQVTAPNAAEALDWLDGYAHDREAAGLRRSLVARGPDGADIDLASNDYLGLSRHPAVIDAAAAAVRTWGTGSTGSRLVTGTTVLHEAFEDRLARFVGAEAGLCFSSGYLANLGAVTALAGRGSLIVSDGGSHASLVDACRLSRARVVVVPRGDVAAARAALADRPEERALVLTDSVYSADGALAPVAELYAAAREYRAALLVDEAHGLGVRGDGGRGLVDELGLAGAPDLVVTATMSKALGSQGGVVLGAERVRAHLIDAARPFIFDTGLAPAAVAAADAALTVIEREPARVVRVLDRARAIAAGVGALEPASAVVSLVLGDPERAVAARDACAADGVRVGCFRPPSVPEGTSRLRITVRADLTDAEIARAVAAIRRAAG